MGRPESVDGMLERGLATQSREVLGSVVQIKLQECHSPLFSICFSELERIERAFSRFRVDSELSKLNQHLGVWQDASAELLGLVEQAEAFRMRTAGNFDISLKARLEQLGYDPEYSFKPKEKEDPRRIPASPFSSAFQLDIPHGRILLHKEIEFGGLGKGYAADQVARLLESKGVHHYYINAGGDIYAKKEAPNTPPWFILLEHPDDPERVIGKIELDGRGIAGSAPNRRRWGENGRLHHLLNAKTGEPAEGVKAIFVVAKTGIEADAYATAIFTAGFEEGIALSQKLPVEILFVSSKDEMYQSPGFDAELF